jgi:hypothetical protein
VFTVRTVIAGVAKAAVENNALKPAIGITLFFMVLLLNELRGKIALSLGIGAGGQNTKNK